MILISINCFAQQESSVGLYNPDTGEYSWALTSPNVTQTRLDQKRIESIQNYTQRIERAERVYYISKGDRETIFVEEQILSVFDNFVVKPNGEIEVFNYVLSHGDPREGIQEVSAEFNVISMGFVQGKISTIPSEGEPLKILKIEEGNFRRKNEVNEITLYNANNEGKNSQYFLLVKKLKKGSANVQFPESDLLIYQKSDDILVTLSDLNENIFENNFDNLPENDYLKLSCDGDCSSLWYVNLKSDELFDTFLVGGSFRITSETSNSLKGTQTDRNKVDIKFDLGGEEFKDNKVLGKLLFSPNKTRRAWTPEDAPRGILNMDFFDLRNILDIEGVKFETNKLNLYVIDEPHRFNDYYVWRDYMKVDITNTDNIENFIFSAYEFLNMNHSRKNVISFHRFGTEMENRLFFLSRGLLKFWKSGFSMPRCDSFYQNMFYFFASACYSLDNNHLLIRSTDLWPTEIVKTSIYNDMAIEFFPRFQEKYIIEYQEISNVYNGLYNYPTWNNLEGRHIGIISPYNENLLGYLNLERLKRGVLFTRPAGANWNELNLGVSSLKMWVYDDIFHKARLLECGPEGCKLDGHMISSPRTYINCRSNEDCKSEGEICIDSLCVNEVEECKEYKELSAFNILFIGMDYTEQQLRSQVDKIFNEFKDIHVFNNNIHLFGFHYKPIGHRELFRAEVFAIEEFDIRLIERIHNFKCKGFNPDVIVFITPKHFRSWAYNDVIALSSLDDHLGYVFAHELGHVFDLADEYYLLEDQPQPGINCAPDYAFALMRWSALLGDEGEKLANTARDNEDYHGCGAGCIDCLRPHPDMDTLMGENNSPGARFSKVAEAHLEKQLSRLIYRLL